MVADYGHRADAPFDASAIARVAIATGPAHRLSVGRIPRVENTAPLAWVLILLLLALLVAALVAAGRWPTDRELRVPDSSLLVSRDGVILSVDVDSGIEKPLSTGTIVAISPDRTRFIRGALQPSDEPAPCYLSRADGSDVEALPGCPVGTSEAWSPDGTDLVLRNNLDGRFEIIDLESGARTPLPDPTGFFDSASWSPDGAYLLVSSDGSIHSELRALKIITRAGHPVEDIPYSQGGGLDSPIGLWSPDGHWIASQYCRDCIHEGTAVFGIDNLLRLSGPVNVPGEIGSWSPDGRWLVTVEGSEPATIHLVPVSSFASASESRPPMQINVATLSHRVVWSPDGHRLAFAEYTGTEVILMLADLTGDAPKILLTMPSTSAESFFDW